MLQPFKPAWRIDRLGSSTTALPPMATAELVLDKRGNVPRPEPTQDFRRSGLAAGAAEQAHARTYTGARHQGRSQAGRIGNPGYVARASVANTARRRFGRLRASPMRRLLHSKHYQNMSGVAMGLG